MARWNTRKQQDPSQALRAAISTGNACDLDRLLKLADYEKDRRWLIVDAAKAGRKDLVTMLVERGWFPDGLSKADEARLEEMATVLLRGPDIYRPSRFWATFNDFALRNLRFMGIENFKRSVNQMYGNFLPRSVKDIQLASLRRYRRRSMCPSGFRFENPDSDRDLWFTLYGPLQLFHDESGRSDRLYRMLLRYLYDYLYATGLGEVAAEFEEPTLGNPIRAWLNGRMISQDLATSLDEWAFVERCSGKFYAPPARVIGEFGAGYGRLAYVFLKKTRSKYVIFDVPPALHIAEWYLTRLFPDRKVFAFRDFDRFDDIAAELSQADIAFFTANQAEKFPDGYFDLFVSISSLHEFTRQQISHYIREMDRLTRHHLFIKQYHAYENLHDGLVISRQDYEFPGPWRIAREETCVVNPRFFQIVFDKR